jgi:hypothetical protein
MTISRERFIVQKDRRNVIQNLMSYKIVLDSFYHRNNPKRVIVGCRKVVHVKIRLTYILKEKQERS